MSTTPKKRPNRPPRRNFAAIHNRPLPIQTHLLPAVYPHNPLSLLSLALTILIQTIFPPSSHAQTFNGYYDQTTQSVHVTDQADIRGLWEQGFFGKGSLSRSEPEWLEREKKRLLDPRRGGGTSGELTSKRREERRQAKRERARQEREAIEKQLRDEGKLSGLNGDTKWPSTNATANTQDSTSEMVLHGQQTGKESDRNGKSVSQEIYAANAGTPNSNTPDQIKQQQETLNENQRMPLDQEHLQLTPTEAFFLAYGLGVLTVSSPNTRQQFSNSSLLDLFRRNLSFPTAKHLPADDPFLLSYAVYHHFRSLGWVVRPGIKFACDYLLYARGPVFAHAEFAVLIVPSYEDPYWRETENQSLAMKRHGRKDWWWLHCVNRVETQVKKTLVLAYVEVPAPKEEIAEEFDIGSLLEKYAVRQFIFRRWSANRNRD